jgi:hypothetical protein
MHESSINELPVCVVSVINQSKRNTSNVRSLTHLGQEHQAPDHEATQLMLKYYSVELDAWAHGISWRG